jgi:predicted nucleic acid-binding protein
VRVFVDANILLAAMLQPGGRTARQLQRKDILFAAPSYVVEELRKAADELRKRARVGTREWRRREQAALRRIQLLPLERLKRHERRPLVVRIREIDPKDAVYAAAFLAFRAEVLWTRDVALLQSMPEQAVRILPVGP